MYFEEFIAGQRFTSPQRTITQADLKAFVQLSGLDLPMFMSDDAARQAGHHRRIIPAPLQLSLAMGLTKAAGVFDQVKAVAGFDGLRFLRPVHPGDSLQVHIEVAETRKVSRQDRGLVLLDFTALVDGQAVMKARGIYLMALRG